jgi:hypothetical protein
MNQYDVQPPRRPPPQQQRARRKTDGTRPFSYFEFLLAGRYLRARRQEGWISVVTIFSVLGITLGVATLIIVMSVMNGFRAEIMAKILGFRGHYMIQSSSGTLDNWDSMAARIAKVPGVSRATPFVEGQALATSQGMSPGVVVRGLRPQDIANIKLVSDSLKPGALQRFQRDNSSVLMGETLANNMGLQQGMNVTLISPRGNVTPFGVTPRLKQYRIAGTFRVGMSLYDSNMIFMPMAEAQEYFNKGKGASGIEVMVNQPDKVDGMRPIIEKIAPDAAIYDWRHTDPDFFSALEVERTVMFFILTMIIIVAGQDQGHRDPAHDGRRPWHDPARVPDVGLGHRHRGHVHWLDPGCRVLLEHREYPPVPDLDHRRQPVPGDALLPEQAAGQDGHWRDRAGGLDFACADHPRDGLSRLARRPPRSG